ncbi:phosphotriesterase-related protein [Arthrobacter sp. MI7-26]|uniref:phosphotriesterase family protein n=1 Tax=Arthrobacter sp. MI7-26 TaxID=2993653 RepID=UPI0022498102|nr:phosphotriesterase-related protein [Arthrobacter sp. MI7-26]MCX2748074.1 phosphotriesterase-related protein [Arthrobacter sp. MI7-26]
MTTIPTAAGNIDSSELGRTLVHEHIFTLGEEYRVNYQSGWNEEEMIERAINDLSHLADLGIDTILDPTVLGLGRYIPRIAKIARSTRLNIVVATGLYTFNDVPMQFHYRGPGLLFDEPEPLVRMFVTDLTEGIAETGIRAAFLKCAIDQPGLTPGVERAMRAVARAAVETGAPITVHTNAAERTGLIAVDVLRQEGVDLTKVIIGHSGDSTDLDYLSRLADAGTLLGLDRFGVDAMASFEDRVSTLVSLLERGYASSIVISHDASCFIDFFDAAAKRSVMPNWNYRHISEDVLPELRRRGVTESQLRTILVDNPRRYFE